MVLLEVNKTNYGCEFILDCQRSIESDRNPLGTL